MNSTREQRNMQTDIGIQDYWSATALAAVAAVAVPQKEPVTLNADDGSVYHGHVNDRGTKHGQGTLKTDVYITGVVGDENSHQTRWTEFSGTWYDGLMHGRGVIRHMCDNGVIHVMYDGMWCNGVPVLDDEQEQDDDAHESETEQPEYDDAYYDRMEGSETPQRGDYDHSEEAS